MPMASVARRPTVLIVLHQEHSTPGRVGAVLKAMGARLDIRRPSLDDPLPAKACRPRRRRGVRRPDGRQRLA